MQHLNGALGIGTCQRPNIGWSFSHLSQGVTPLHKPIDIPLKPVNALAQWRDGAATRATPTLTQKARTLLTGVQTLRYDLAPPVVPLAGPVPDPPCGVGMPTWV